MERIHDRWVSVRVHLQQKLQQPLSRITDFPVKETNITKSTKTVIETRCVETNEHFRFLEECVEWVNGQMVR